MNALSINFENFGDAVDVDFFSTWFYHLIALIDYYWYYLASSKHSQEAFNDNLCVTVTNMDDTYTAQNILSAHKIENL